MFTHPSTPSMSTTAHSPDCVPVARTSAPEATRVTSLYWRPGPANTPVPLGPVSMFNAIGCPDSNASANAIPCGASSSNTTSVPSSSWLAKRSERDPFVTSMGEPTSVTSLISPQPARTRAPKSVMFRRDRMDTDRSSLLRGSCIVGHSAYSPSS